MQSKTPKESSHTVRVFLPDRARTIRQIRQAMKEAQAKHAEIERVILFGSLSRGDAVPGSDNDILLVLRESSLPYQERSVYYMPECAGIGVDLFAYTRAEIEEMVNSNVGYSPTGKSELPTAAFVDP